MSLDLVPTILTFDGARLAEAAGWTVLHATWQGLLIAAMVRGGLFLLRGSSAQARYALAAGSLAVMGAAPLATFAWLWVQPAGGGHLLSGLLPLSGGLLDAPAWTQLWVPALGVCWAAGATIAQLRVCLQWWRLQGLRRRLSRPEGSALQREVDRLCRRLGVGPRVRVVESDAFAAPAVLGGGVPLLVVPGFLRDLLPIEQVRAVLAHELAHVRRHDFAVNLMQSVCEAMWFFHPAVWWVSSRIREEREYCCDDAALVVCGNPFAMARALTTLEEWKLVEPGLALGSTGGALMKRIQRLVGRPERGSTAVDGRWVSLTLLGGMVSLALVIAGLGCGESFEETSAPQAQAEAREVGASGVPGVPGVRGEAGSPAAAPAAGAVQIVELEGEDGKTRAYTLHADEMPFGDVAARTRKNLAEKAQPRTRKENTIRFGEAPGLPSSSELTEVLRRLESEVASGALSPTEMKLRLQELHEAHEATRSPGDPILEVAP